MLKVKDEIISSKYFTSSEYLDKYLQLIYSSTLDNDYERHHILPVKLFPQYKNDKSNIVRLSFENHLKAHVYLYFIFKEINMSFALNLMINRGKSDKLFYKYSEEKILELFENNKEKYSEFRKNMKSFCSKLNRNRIHDKQFSEKCSKNTKGKVVVYDIDNPNKTFRINIDDENYIAGKYVYYRTNTKHKQETIEKMKKHSIKGKSAYTNSENITVYSNNPIEGYIKGRSDAFKKKISETHKDLIWVENIKTGEKTRISIEKFDKTIYKRKRYKSGNFQGWDKLNKKIRVYDIRNKETKYIDKKDVNLDYHICSWGICGGDNNKRIYEFNNNYFYKWYDLRYYLNKLNITISKEEYEQNIIIPNKIHFNMTPIKKKMIEIYGGQHIQDIVKIKIYNLENFYYNNNGKLYRRSINE